MKGEKGKIAYESEMLLQLSLGTLAPGGGPTAIQERFQDLCIFSLLCSSFNKTSVLASADEIIQLFAD